MRCVLAVLLVLCACRGPSPEAGSNTGSGGGSGAARIVALTPSASEVVGALGAASLLVGVDEYSTYPPEVASLPKVGSFLSPNIEAIVRLRPTLVIVDDVHKEAAGALHDAGLATADCAMHKLADVRGALRSVADRLGRRAEADRAITEIDAALAAAKQRVPSVRPRVLAIIDREAGGLGNLVAAGPASWVDELLAVVGAVNVLAASPVMYPKLSMEEVLRTQPEVILDLSFAARAKDGAWRDVPVPAVANGRVVALAEPYLIAPSPRVKAALEAISSAVHARPR
ncbi:MAG: ABC transporter substrate-binding protein [Deltaproteobacteria bacterium]|nr:ABC transporter substrate-binding protein [Deltaproteobacteria bacterium]